MGKYLTEKQAKETAKEFLENSAELEDLRYYTLKELKMILNHLGGIVEEFDRKAICREKILDICKKSK